MTIDEIMEVVDGYGNAEHDQDDGQALYSRNLVYVKISDLINQQDTLKVAARLALTALKLVYRQSSHDMVLTSDEERTYEKAVAELKKVL